MSLAFLAPSVALAQAAGAAPQQPSFVEAFLIPGVFLVLIMFFLVIRPQQKKIKEQDSLLKSLKAGDEVVTTGGIIGRIRSVAETFVTLEVASNTSIKVTKNHIAGLTTPPAQAAVAAKK